MARAPSHSFTHIIVILASWLLRGEQGGSMVTDTTSLLSQLMDLMEHILLTKTERRASQ